MATRLPTLHHTSLLFFSPYRRSRNARLPALRPLSSSSDDSYLAMWKNAVQRERKSQEFQRLSGEPEASDGVGENEESLAKKTEMFNKILEVPKEERDKAQSLQVIDRAAAAIAAARAIIKEAPPPKPAPAAGSGSDGFGLSSGGDALFLNPASSGTKTPGPDFWSWSPPLETEGTPREDPGLEPARRSNSSPNPSSSLPEKEIAVELLAIPFESSEEKHSPPLPPFQSLVEIEKIDSKTSNLDLSSTSDERKLEVLFLRNAAEAAEALGKSNEASVHGVNTDGSKWWRETGKEQRPDGVVFKWTLTRGVSADGSVEWEDKFWEASDQFDYKELGSEKSGRDAFGNVWREYWRESMWQDLRTGLTHMEKTADKWGKNDIGDEWQEKWWEHYDASGQAEKWAHKWCCIDPHTPLEAGHAHVWHEKWGENYDGKGSSMKYTDKWAERSEGDGWSKWGDKWDEHFDSSGSGVKQGETWWEGKYGERWNRTWGEQHNGSGWVHKYGKSSSGEHWDTHVQQETWYEKYPHYGFQHCFENSVQLRAVQRPSEKS
ncbi:hypothetical protein J5N97_009865 [Dioscorea zingiberensis]|uniref:Uncharacterized protein n=1 Tax=Dioscorea zingiberensis TaxID=325984 RepID=A0A9D5D0A6_9LILI|nr:hypothetical protein J5N97_009865 [Dioscorea zingiberensis]